MNSLKFESFITSHVLGVPASLAKEIAKRIALSEANLDPLDKPLGAFLLTGDPGTGKTLTAQKVAEFLHGSRSKLLHIAGEDYQMGHEVLKLRGAPPSYLGHRETPPILGKVAIGNLISEKSSIKVILVDEIDKTHREFSTTFLNILESGFTTMGDNTLTKFNNCLFFFTANWGAEAKEKSARWGYVEKVDQTATANDIRRGISPALLDRIKSMGGIHEFPKMTENHRREIIRNTVEDLEYFLLDRRSMRVSLKVHSLVMDELCGTPKEQRSGREVAMKTKDYIMECLLENREILERLTGNERDKTKNTTLEILPGGEMRQIQSRAKGATEGV